MSTLAIIATAVFAAIGVAVVVVIGVLVIYRLYGADLPYED